MHVQITRTERARLVPLGPGIRGVAPIPLPTAEFHWALVKTDGEVVVRGPHGFPTEKECRSQIAEAKKSMKGASRCKVVSPPDA